MADPPAATPTVPPADAHRGPPHLPVDDSPVRPSDPWDTDRRSVELTLVDDDTLVLEPGRWSAVRHLPLVLAGTVGPIAGLVYLLLDEAQGNPSPIGVLILVAGLLLAAAVLVSAVLAPRGFHRWVRFDRRTGRMTVRRRPSGFRRSHPVVRSRPLTDVVGVQLLYAGWHRDDVETGEPGTPGGVIHRTYHSYQLNLVVGDGEGPRLNLCSHADVEWMRGAGRRLASFLRVPLVDQIPESH